MGDRADLAEALDDALLTAAHRRIDEAGEGYDGAPAADHAYWTLVHHLAIYHPDIAREIIERYSPLIEGGS